jgi:hypothetical protein
MLLGHESAGTVVEFGAGVTDVKVGERVGRPLPVWGSDVILVWRRALLLAPIETLPGPLTESRVFRERTADATISWVTAANSCLHFHHTGMRRDLKRTSASLGLPADTVAIADRVLRWWVVTYHYCELAFASLWVKSRRYSGEGSRVCAPSLVPPMAFLGPRMNVNGFRRAWRDYSPGRGPS